MAERKESKRAREFWSRLLAWYGARVGDSYGMLPPVDWCEVIDRASPETIRRTLAEIRSEHPVHPPTFPQFDEIVSRLSFAVARGPLVQERLREFVCKHRSISAGQLWRPWTFVYNKDECVAVDVPEDGNTPGFRVRVEDMERM
jgi:hypothetical protein